MERPYILHMFTPGKQMSPFDVNMAADAGYQLLPAYCDVGLDMVTALTQDAIFSRGQKGLARTAIFIGGRDALLAADMLERARTSMVPPFVISLMADPSGSFTTAAAMVACVEAALQKQHGHGLAGQRVVILGGMGPVGRIAGVLAAGAGAQVSLSSRNGIDMAEEAAQQTAKRFGVTLHGVSGGDRAAVRTSIAEADVLLACAAAGVQVVSAEDLTFAKDLKVAADVNAVPPEGIAGVGVMDSGKPLAGTAAVGIGALAIGNVKYQTQQQMLISLHETEKPLVLSFAEAFEVARRYLPRSLKPGMGLLVVAAVSARALAEAARLDGHEVLALDLFGDRDTRAASPEWHPIGLPGSLRIDADQLMGALRQAARRGALGWIAGSGFDGQPELLTQGASVLPLLGTPGDAVAAVRDPRRFFEALRSDGIAHPPVRFRRPVPADGWLLKDAGSCGGWHVRAASPDDPDPPLPGWHWQQQALGLPMSMTLLADGQRALVLGINTQLIEPHGGHAFVFTGVIGPVPAPERMRQALQGMADRLVHRFRLRGVCGVDFLCHGDELVVLEVNPRPPASAALYAPRGGLINAHLAACLQGHLPSGEAWASLRGDGRLRGLRYVFARRRLSLDAARLARLAARPGVHDVPHAPLTLSAGEPLCSLSDSGDDVPTLQASLARAGERLLTDLENP